MKNGIALFLFLWSLGASAQTLFVSDVDDTIKLANVKDLAEAARYAFDDESRFMGMSELYHLLKRDQPDIHVVYLSKAPEWFMGGTHRRFLKNGNFPEGRYIPRTNYDSDVHKLKTLRGLIAEIKPQKVILIGDNGEQDADIYKAIADENPGVEFTQFIRIVYSRNSFVEWGARLHDGQVGFVTPIEVALDLEEKRFLTLSSLQSLVNEMAPKILMQKSHGAKGEVAFPYFMNCRNFVWKWDASLPRFEILEMFKARLADRCQPQSIL
ncbi:phosphatase domain-containing protein [Bdellovibrio bacteriovorus]|uniref:phosphatase domain-containing protein n=1 Tax=Bdellovibrio bacteriovorus TaxID=959 RepID=UPI0035A6AEEA